MQMFGHDDIPSDDEAEALPHLFPFPLEDPVPDGRVAQVLFLVVEQR
jgi:hypothetical protein